MKRIATICLWALSALYCWGQQQVLVVEPYQETETALTASPNLVKLPQKMAFPVIGGLSQWDGLKNSIDVFGSRLVIERSEIGMDGITRLTLRREDGRLFFDLFPLLKVQLISTDMLTAKKGNPDQIAATN